MEAVVREEVIKNLLSGHPTNKMKQRAWQLVADNVNAVCGRQQSIYKMKSKLRQEKCRVLKNVKRRRYETGTGGGPARFIRSLYLLSS